MSLPTPKPKKEIQKYKLDKNKMKAFYGSVINSSDKNATYLYQRACVPEDRRFAVAYGMIEPGKYADFFWWYDEVVVTISGKARIKYMCPPKYDRWEQFELSASDVFVVAPGVRGIWQNISKTEPWIYMIVAIPAGDKFWTK